ncbi:MULTISPECIES: OsmC family protein [unclassified Paenibacillus]|uniref:OsmC family protein n=1 Tax=unclassified Paenibacillus TaxID=185978 RepID=UPI0024049185|nr:MULTISPECIES: OsmC family protein [unclassified Paenibacillus]MDF9841448.1 peroxiredoxin-like protein [Paenibacillus sp. PastF-2]MDF9848038.1 peroxiredoxin-like protein [Paenibacillus sp. PastM-2]MDF9854607.1 peroxiredoxin-like protein [Paenibacillus sp. PastF-1]MDH6479785.1 peroxiredoxin-like protein [Paenibacillus sp. PastH-2]MDH6507313.1 peroxiredoxin-like protein [Paenibacillus sp. PastM-3]
MKHPFHLKAVWNGGRNSEGHIDAGGLKTVISIPQEMGGPGTGTNPDEMLLGAAATCYLITLAAMLERSDITPQELTLESEATVDVTNNVFTYERIVHKPRIVLRADVTEAELAKTERLAHKAEQSCMISRAVAGNVAIETLPSIVTAEPDAV